VGKKSYTTTRIRIRRTKKKSKTHASQCRPCSGSPRRKSRRRGGTACPRGSASVFFRRREEGEGERRRVSSLSRAAALPFLLCQFQFFRRIPMQLTDQPSAYVVCGASHVKISSRASEPAAGGERSLRGSDLSAASMSSLARVRGSSAATVAAAAASPPSPLSPLVRGDSIACCVETEDKIRQERSRLPAERSGSLTFCWQRKKEMNLALFHFLTSLFQIGLVKERNSRVSPLPKTSVIDTAFDDETPSSHSSSLWCRGRCPMGGMAGRERCRNRRRRRR